LDSGESGTFPKVRRKEKNLNKNMASSISDQQEESSMIFLPRVAFTLDGIRRHIGDYFAIGRDKMV
jgi:hypothetical protein